MPFHTKSLGFPDASVYIVRKFSSFCPMKTLDDVYRNSNHTTHVHVEHCLLTILQTEQPPRLSEVSRAWEASGGPARNLRVQRSVSHGGQVDVHSRARELHAAPTAAGTPYDSTISHPVRHRGPMMKVRQFSFRVIRMNYVRSAAFQTHTLVIDAAATDGKA